jgi:hypothetical protein
MPILLYPKCWRNRDDCEPIHCIDSAPEDTKDDDIWEFNYTPTSFVCSGCIKNESRVVNQDIYRLCFKNKCSDEMTDNDVQDLSSVIAVAAQALALDSVRKVNSGIIEIPAENK